jgi:protein SCO1/2
MRLTTVRRISFLILPPLLSLLLAACGSSSRDSDAGPDGGENGYALAGTVISIDPERRRAVVDHEEIPGYMPAMVMEFIVSSGDLGVLKEGMYIRARMVQTDDGYALHRIWPADRDKEGIIDAAGSALRQDTVIRGRGAYREIGENLPDFALYDQTGNVVQVDRFIGKQIVLNFIFTRCPDPKMCPASTAKMMGLQAAARGKGVNNLELISVTLDPEYDTPGILNEYATLRGIDTSNFSFLTGPETAIRDLMLQMGVLAFPDDGLVRHTLATMLIDVKGKIIYRSDSSGWQFEDFVKRLQVGDGAT